MAEPQGDGQDKSHEATPRRLEQAREKGDVPRSQDAQTFAAYLGLAAALGFAGSWSAIRLGEALTAALAHPGALAGELFSAGSETWGVLAGRVLMATLPAVVLPAAAVLALLAAQRSIVFAADKAAPKLSRISPLENAKQKYGPTGLVEFAKSAVKLVAVGAVLALVLVAEADRLPGYVALSPEALGPLLAVQVDRLLLGVALVAGGIGLADLFWQRHQFQVRNRMSHQELRDESKQAEGDPHLKAERQGRARKLADTRMMLDVPRADVVVTNPTHFAVALKWDKAPGSAPVCLAKGVDHMALTIRTRAEAAGVPIHEDPGTARSIHALVEVGQEVRPEHYRAVAAAILFAEDMRKRARRPWGGGQEAKR